MATAKEIQSRIKSIANTKKVTRAMEMVAAVKMRKAIEAVLRTRTYANLSWLTVLNLSQANGQGKEAKALHPLFCRRPKIKRVAIILITSNRGLCGGFNTAIINKAHQSIQKHQSSQIDTEFILIGKKGALVNRYYGYKIAAEFPKQDLVSRVEEVISIAGLAIADFLSGRYDKVMVAYTDFVSPAKQVPRVKQLLPVDIEAQDEYLGIVGQDTRVGLDEEFIAQKKEKYLKDKKFRYEYLFEPSAEEVLAEMVPRLIEVQLFQALLESNASEHSARMAAMHQATDAAEEMVKELTLFYNKARQSAITAEIAEISAGAEALSE